MSDQPILEQYAERYGVILNALKAFDASLREVDDRLNRVQLNDRDYDFSSEIEQVHRFISSVVSELPSTEQSPEFKQQQQAILDAFNQSPQTETQAKRAALTIQDDFQQYVETYKEGFGRLDDTLKLFTERPIQEIDDPMQQANAVFLRRALEKEGMEDVLQTIHTLADVVKVQNQPVQQLRVDDLYIDDIDLSHELVVPINDIVEKMTPAETALARVYNILQDSQDRYDVAKDGVGAIVDFLSGSIDNMRGDLKRTFLDNRDYNLEASEEVAYMERMQRVTDEVQETKLSTIERLNDISHALTAVLVNNSDELTDALEKILHQEIEIDTRIAYSNAMNDLHDPLNDKQYETLKKALTSFNKKVEEAAAEIGSMPIMKPGAQVVVLETISDNRNDLLEQTIVDGANMDMAPDSTYSPKQALEDILKKGPQDSAVDAIKSRDHDTNWIGLN